MRTRWLLLLCTVLAGAAWLLPAEFSLFDPTGHGYDSPDHPKSFPLSKVVKQTQPPFHIDPDQPWFIEFGRGSGWHGLDTIKLSGDGALILHRRRSLWHQSAGSNWETSNAVLPPESIAKVLLAIETNDLMNLEKDYHAAVTDGTQWVIWMRQGGRERAVYFDNHFLAAILQFADEFDSIIKDSVGPGLVWNSVPFADEGKHQRELWDSINR